MLPLTLAALVFAPMLVEALRSVRNERRLRDAGAVEPSGDVYRVMRVAYPACFLAPIAEGSLRSTGFGTLFIAGLALFVAAKGLKYWAMSTLGARWSFRVLVPPGSSRITAGPYRFMRHPNYVAVLGELAGVALMAGAPVSGAIAMSVFPLLILARLRVEERALRGRESRS